MRTWLTEHFDLSVPVVSAPMAGASGGELAAAVSVAGGLGMIGVGSAEKRIPESVWRGPRAFKQAFLRALFEGDGSMSLLPRNSIQISYSTYSDRLARDVQQLLPTAKVQADDALKINGILRSAGQALDEPEQPPTRVPLLA